MALQPGIYKSYLMGLYLVNAYVFYADGFDTLILHVKL